MKKRKLELKHILAFVLAIILIFIIFCFVNKYFSENFLFKISYEEFISKYDNNEELILLIYREDCYNCDTYIKTVKQAANSSRNIIYYIDIDDIKDPKQYSNLWNITKVDGSPAIVKINNKEIIGSEVGSKTKSEVIKFIKE